MKIKMAALIFMMAGLATLPLACRSEPVVTIVKTVAVVPVETMAIEANLTTGCVENYHSNFDYFPNKIKLDYATGWTVEYFNNYKVIEVVRPWQDARRTFQYLLFQCGTPIPEGYDQAQVIEVPVKTIATMSTTYLPHLDKLGLLDGLVAVDDFDYINTPAVRRMIEWGQLAEIGSGPSVNVEMMLDLNPDVVMTYGSGRPEFDAYPKLLEARLDVALNSEHMETSPLGRAEWLKFTAMFFNREADAEKIFANTAARYEELAAKARSLEPKPTVLTGTDYNGVWAVPGGQSFVAAYLADAGAAYLWAGDETTGSQPLDFETVYERAAQADYWLNPGTWSSTAEALAADERYANFAALQNGRIYNNNARLNEQGGNDYWESGMTNPDVVLADLIKIFHPKLLPEHQLVYYRQLE